MENIIDTTELPCGMQLSFFLYLNSISFTTLHSFRWQNLPLRKFLLSSILLGCISTFQRLQIAKESQGGSMQERLFLIVCLGSADRYIILFLVIGSFTTLLQCPSCLFHRTLRAGETFATSVFLLDFMQV